MAHSGKSPLLSQGDAAVIEQVPITAEAGAALFVYKVQMPVKRPALPEHGDVFGHQSLFLPTQRAGIFRVHGGKAHGVHGVYAAFQPYCALFPVHPGKHQPVVHMIARMAQDHLALQLRGQHRKSLMHRLGLRVPIDLGAEGPERAQGYAVAPLQGGLVAIVQADAEHRCYAGLAPCGGAHP